MFPLSCKRVFPSAAICLSAMTMLASVQTASAQQWSAPAWVMSADQQRDYSRIPTGLMTHRRDLSSANPAEENVKKVIHYYLSQLLRDPPGNLPKDVTDRLLNDINSPRTSPNARIMMLNEILARAPELLNHPSPDVRINAIALAAQLSVSGTTPFNPAGTMLLDVVNNPEQSRDARILAVRGLTRICRDGRDVSSREKSDIANAFVKALAEVAPSSADANWWFRYRLIEGLGNVDRIDNDEGVPIVIDTLMQIMTNRRETWFNRSQAALSVTQLPWTAQTNVPLITYEIMKLTRDMAAAQGRNPSRDAFVRLYLAFRPAKAAQANEKRWGLLYQVQRPGLGGYANLTQGAWQAAFPLLKPIVENTPGPVNSNAVQALTDWLDANAPSDRRAVPHGKELAAPPAAASAQSP